MGVEYRVVISDRSLNVLEFLDKDIIDLQWEYARIGGCGSFSLTLPRQYCSEKYISGDFNVKIYIRNPSTGAFDLWYQGFVQEKQAKVSNGQEMIDVSGHGYFDQLSRYYVDEDYSSTEISAIVKDILDDYVTTPSDITYDAGDVVDTGYTPDTLEFNTDAKNALETLADIAGSREWGVDKDRKFFFKAKSSTASWFFTMGRYVTDFSADQSFGDIVNRIIVQGAESAGTPFTRTVNDLSSQAKYGRRDRVVQNSAISTNDVADQYGASLLADLSMVIRSGSCSLVGHNTRIEATVPIPLFAMKEPGVTYGTQKYGEFLYSGVIGRQITRITYSIDSNSEMTTKLTLDKTVTGLADQLKRMDYELEQQRSQAL